MVRVCPALFSLCLLIALTGDARATSTLEEEARTLYQQGKDAFGRQAFDEAQALFKKAYLVYPAPEFMYNLASALQGAGRPHDAAEALRAFLRLRPAYEEQKELEARIRALEEAQRMLDAERALHSPVPDLVAVPDATQRKPRWTRRDTKITIGATVGGVVILGSLALGLALGLHDWHTRATLGEKTVTP